MPQLRGQGLRGPRGQGTEARGGRDYEVSVALGSRVSRWEQASRSGALGDFLQEVASEDRIVF